MSLYSPLRDSFDALNSSFVRDVECMKDHSKHASLWRQVQVLGSDLSGFSQESLDRMENSFGLHEMSKKNILLLRSDVLKYMGLANDLLCRIDSEFSPLELPPCSSPEKVYRHAFDLGSCPDDVDSPLSSNWSLNHKARCELRRVVPLDPHGVPIATNRIFPFGNVRLYGWEVVSLYNSLNLGPRKLSSVLWDMDDSCYEGLEESWNLLLPTDADGLQTCDDADLNSYEEAPDNWQRLVVPVARKRPIPSSVLSTVSGSGGSGSGSGGSGSKKPRRTSLLNVDKCLKDLKDMAVRIDGINFHEMHGVESEVHRNILVREKTIASRISKGLDVFLLKGPPSVCSPYFLRLDKADDVRPGIYDDVDVLRTFFGYPSHHMVNCMYDKGKYVKGVVLKDWSIYHRYCLDELLRSYRAWVPERPVPEYSNDELMRMSTFLDPECPLFSSGFCLSSALTSLAKKFLGCSWFDKDMSTYPRMIIFQVHEVLKEQYPTYDVCFSIDTPHHEEKVKYIENYMNGPFCTPDIRTKVMSLLQLSQAADGGTVSPADVIEAYKFVVSQPKVTTPPAVIMQRDSDDDEDE